MNSSIVLSENYASLNEISNENEYSLLSEAVINYIEYKGLINNLQ